MGSSSNNNKNNKTNKRRKPCPQPGDPEYKTPTQLRNARKRRKLQRNKQQPQSTTAAKNNPSNSNNNAQDPQSKAFTPLKDPSLKYIANPTGAPTVKAAKQFFEGIFQTHQPNYHFPIIVGPKEGWRTVARLAVRQQKEDKQQLEIGLFVPGSHQLLPVPHCLAHHPSVNTAVQVLQDTCRQLHVQAFDETTGAGNLRYVAVAVERSTGKQQVVLVWKEQQHDGGASQATLQKLVKKLIAISDMAKEQNCNTLDLHSLWVHYNNAWKHANSIFDRQGEWKQQPYGEEGGRIQELLLPEDKRTLLHVPLLFPPQVFRQANLDGFANIVIKIRQWLTERLASIADSNIPKQKNQHKRFGNCLELYGGVGTIGLNLVDLFDSLVSSDENPHNKTCFESSVDKITVQGTPLRQSRRERIVYHSKSATAMMQGPQGQQLLNDADVIVVDPPRKGLDQEVIDALNAGRGKSSHPKALVYVSCGFDAFRRDYGGLTKSGRWILDHAEGHVLFPGSDAIETLAFFKTKETCFKSNGLVV